MKIAHEIADIVVQDPDGKDVRLGSMWDGRAVVLVFVRHFG